MKVIGLAPSSVRIDLQPCELPVLVDELLERVHAQSGSLLDERGSSSRAPDTERLRDATDWLLEYRNLLAAVADEDSHPRRQVVSVITPVAVAESLVPACCEEALERVTALLEPNSPRKDLQPAAEAVGAWIDTLIALRYLDEEALEANAL